MLHGVISAIHMISDLELKLYYRYQKKSEVEKRKQFRKDMINLINEESRGK